jgi:integrase
MAHWDTAKGAWRIQADATRPEDDKRRRVVRLVKQPNTDAGRRAAEAEETRLRDRVADDLEGPRADLFSAVARAWHRRARGPRGAWSPNTRRVVGDALEGVILPDLGEYRADEITPGRIEDFYAHLERRYQPSTVQRYHRIVARIYADLERRGEIRADRNPMRRVGPPGGKAPERDIPTPEELGRILAEVADRSPAVGVFLEVAAATGIRRGSMLALRWRHIDLEAGVIRVSKSLAIDENGAYVEKGTKSGARFAVALRGRALESLREHRRRAVESALAVGATARLDDLYVFSSDGGESPFSAGHPSHIFRHACRAVNLEGYHLHDLRHLAASSMLRAGVPVGTVAERLGCTEANVLRTYSHYLPSDADERAAEVMARVLG